MSSVPPSANRSAEADGPSTHESEITRAVLIGTRGADLLEGLEKHVPGSHRHADGTATYAFAVAVEVGLGREHAEAVRETARLHEVGKIYLPRAALEKSADRLSSEERALLASHFAYGAELARGAGVPEEACAWLHAIQERLDGTGPTGLAGAQIPLESRIIRAACTCDALLSAPIQDGGSTAGRRGWVIGELFRSAGDELDPGVVEALAGMLDRISPLPREA
jgi:HD-GYP domain-containing protein (c-di-GMP phosphodiesterase class II)